MIFHKLRISFYASVSREQILSEPKSNTYFRTLAKLN